MKVIWRQGYDKWVEFRQSVIGAAGNGTISQAEMFKILGNRANMGRGDFFSEVGKEENSDECKII